MANFVEIANSVVTLLEELQTKANTEGDKLLAGAKELETLGEQGKKQVGEINKELDELEQRVTQTRERLFKRLGEVKQKLAKLHFASENFAESIKSDMSQREEKIRNLDSFIENDNQSTKGYMEDIAKSYDAARESLNISNDSMKHEFDKIEKHLEKGEGVLDELNSSYERELRELTDLIEDRGIREVEVNTDRAIEETRNSVWGWRDQMNETTKLLKEDLQTAVERIQKAEAESRADMQTIVDDVQQTYDPQQIDSANDKVQEKTADLNQKFNNSRTNFDNSVSDFSNLHGVMERMVG